MLERFPAFLFFLALPVVMVFLVFRFLSDQRAKRFLIPGKRGEPIPRPPGWSLRQRIDDMRDSMDGLLIVLVVIPLLVGLYYWLVGKNFLPCLAIVFIVTVVVLPFLWRKVMQLRNHRLGLLGEEIVGAKLGRMAGVGTEVYHDLEVREAGRKTWNIDHIVLTASGVFVIETKMRRRKKGTREENREAHKVKFDGTALHFPTWTDRHGIDQARRNGEWLAKKLADVIGESVPCYAVLTLPGWFISENKKSDVRVLAPAGIEKLIQSKPECLTSQQLAYIRNWLANICSIEFQ